MRKIVKRKTIVLITFGILFTLSLLISNNLNYNKQNRYKITDNDILKISIVSGPIHIDDIDPSINWSVAEAAGICTGKGTYSEPYVIEDLVIDGGALGSGILIENSNVFFRIENCTIYNSGVAHSSHGGIKLERTSNGTIIENNCSNNNAAGILMRYYCYNITITRNIITDNGGSGLSSGSGMFNNTISDNIIHGNDYSGIYLGWGSDNIIRENNVNNCRSGIYLSGCERNSISGNTANNNKDYGIYLYDEVNNNTIWNNTANNNRDGGIAVEDDCHNNIISDNIANYNFWTDEDATFPNPTIGRGIYLSYSSTLNTISGNTVNYNTQGINLDTSSYNNISGNIANNNDGYGIALSSSNNLTISGNTVNYNQDGISLEGSDNNIIIENEASYNAYYGIDIDSSNKIELSENKMNECGLRINIEIEVFTIHNQTPVIHLIQCSHNINTSNLVNGKPLYYYTNEINLGPSNFTNAGQVILVNCSNSLISNLNVSYGSVGISLFYCNDNTISENIANYNNAYGIYLCDSNNNNVSGNTANYNEKGIDLIASDFNIISGNTANYNENGIDLYLSDFNTISGNTLIGNDECWRESTCDNNSFENNDCGYYQPPIPGYDILLIIGVVSIVSATIMKKLKPK